MTILNAYEAKTVAQDSMTQDEPRQGHEVSDAAYALAKRLTLLASVVYHQHSSKADPDPDAIAPCTCNAELRATPALCGVCAMRQLAQLVGYDLANQWLRACRQSRRVWKAMQRTLEKYPPGS